MSRLPRLPTCFRSASWSVLSLVLLACALALFLVYLLAQRLSLRKAGFDSARFLGELDAVAEPETVPWVDDLHT